MPESRHAAVTGNLEKDSLVGSFFLSDEDPPERGQVLAEPSQGIYLIAVWNGDDDPMPDKQMLAPLELMATWRFFDDEEAMNYALPRMAEEQAEERRAGAPGARVGQSAAGAEVRAGDRVRIPYDGGVRTITVAEVKDRPGGGRHFVTARGRVYPVSADMAVEVLPA